MSKRTRQYVVYPSPIRQDSVKDTTKILADLGRATKRGIRRCFKCGTYNGTRGLICKNKQCDAVFKECAEKQKTNLDAIKLVSGTSRQVFSVRVCDKGPECRGFVQLPIIQGGNKEENDVALSEVALCFVDSCQRLFDDSILKCHETDQNKVTSICIHIKSALRSATVALPIETKSSVLNSLNFSEDIKGRLWVLCSEAEGPVVQRVSKIVMAVKCQVTPKHPLGYLHFTFRVARGKVAYDKYFCNCSCFKANCLNDSTGCTQRCIHVYACVWAFASNPKFAEEYIDFLNLILGTRDKKPPTTQAKKRIPSGISNTFKSQEAKLHRNKNLELKTACSLNSLRVKDWGSAELYSTVSFIDWLAAVTEKINQSLLCHQDVSPKTLEYYIPLNFFQLFENRIQNNNSSCSTINHGVDGVSYLIYSAASLRGIFNTPQVQLQAMEIIIHDKNLTCKQTVSFVKIEVGKTAPFSINWHPGALPSSSFGKLELAFHLRVCDAAQLGINIR